MAVNLWELAIDLRWKDAASGTEGLTRSIVNYFFLSIRVFFTDTDNSQDSRGREGTIFYFTLPLPPAHEHSDIYLQLCMWDDYHVFLIATLVFTRLLLDEIYHLIKLPFEWLIDDAMFVCLLDELILGFCYSNLTLETGGFELASSITLVLQANQLTKCVNYFCQRNRKVQNQKSKNRYLCDLLYIKMNEKTIIDSFFFCFELFLSHLFLFCLHFCLLSNFEVILHIVKSLVITST